MVAQHVCLKKPRRIATVLLLSAIIAIATTACSMVGLSSIPIPAVLQKEELPHKVAILPFVNKTSTPEGGQIVRKMFYNFFSSLNYLDVEPYIIDDNLKATGLYQKITAGEAVSPKKLGKALGVDAVIIGEVISLGKIYALLYTDNQAGLKAKMVSCNSGKILWELEHTVHQQKGDVPLSPIGLAATIAKTALSHQQATHMQAAAELSMAMVATIPSPPAVADPPPKIEALVHNGAGKLLRPGDYIRVVMTGEKGNSATWSIPPLMEELPMKEKKPGVYIGAYRVKAQDRLAHGRLIGYLRSDTGTRSQWVDTLGSLKIGEPTLLPPAITGDVVLTVEKSPYLVENALVVLPNAKLTVNPGTVIWFRSLGMVVKGQLQILGTQEDPVHLASMESTSWKGIFIEQSRAENKLAHCQISGAEFGFRASDSKVSIKNCLFQDNIWGIVIEKGFAEIDGSLVRTSAKSGLAARDAQLVITDSVITENNSGGILLKASRVQIKNNNILNNGQWSIKALVGQTPVKAANNWWGKVNPDKNQIIGPVEIQPALKKPIDLKILG